MREHLRAFEGTGVDQLIFIQQAGRNRHESICEFLELFATEVMPEFKERDLEQQRAKSERLEPHIERALRRKQWLPALSDDEIPEIAALGRQIVQVRWRRARKKPSRAAAA